MKEIGSAIYLEFSELVSRFGVSGSTIKSGILRFRKNESTNWANIRDANDKRKPLIEYRSIPYEIRERYKIPPETKLLNEIKLTEALISNKKKETKVVETYLMINKAVKEAKVYYGTYLGEIHKDKIPAIAIQHSVYQFILDASSRSQGADRKKLNTLHGAYMLACEENGELRPYPDYKSFYRVIKRFEERGSLIHKNKGNSHAKKTDAFHEYLTHRLYGNPRKYTAEVIWDCLTANCLKLGKPTPSIGWVKAEVTKPMVRNMYSLYRNGEKHFANTVLPYQPRKRPLFPGDLWIIDGTPIQIPYWNETKKRMDKINFFGVFDGHSRKIVGFDFAETEDRYTILNAIEYAVARTGYLPFEMLHDNASGTKTKEFNHVKEKAESLGVTFRAAKVGNAKDKTIERFFNTFQTRFQARIDEYIGEGIKTKRLNGKRSDELLAKIKDQKEPLTKGQLMDLVVRLVDWYNRDQIKGRPSPEELHDHSNSKQNAQNIKLHATPISVEQRVFIFWKTREITVRNGLIKMQVRNQEYLYKVYEYDDILKLNGVKVRVRYDERCLGLDEERIYLFEMETDEIICECRQVVKIHTAKANQTDKDIVTMSKHNNRNKGLINHIDKKIEEKGEAAALAAEGVNFADLVTPLTATKEQLNMAETREELAFFKQTGLMEGKIMPYEHTELKEDDLLIINQQEGNTKNNSKGIFTTEADYSIKG